jgi:hypothetical protein
MVCPFFPVYDFLKNHLIKNQNHIPFCYPKNRGFTKERTMSVQPIPKDSSAYPTYSTSVQDQTDNGNSVIIHIRYDHHPSTIVSRTDALKCRICGIEKYPDELFSVHDNCKKDICRICLPDLENCPDCSSDIRRKPAQVQVLQTQRIEMVSHTVAPQNPQILPVAPIPVDGAIAAPQAQDEENCECCLCVSIVALTISLFAITHFII